MSVAKPWIASLPAPVTSHSDAGDPGRQFSASISFAGLAQLALAAGAARSVAQVAATTVTAHAHARGVRRDAFTIPPYVLIPVGFSNRRRATVATWISVNCQAGKALTVCRRDQSYQPHKSGIVSHG